MRAILKKDIYVKNHSGAVTTMLEAGEYPIIRFFDGKRVMVVVSRATDRQRSITLLPRKLVEVING